MKIQKLEFSALQEQKQKDRKIAVKERGANSYNQFNFAAQDTTIIYQILDIANT